MNVIIILLGAALLVAAGFLAGFIWAVRSGQYDDTYTPSVRMLFDDEPAPTVSDEKNSKGD
jgi:cbb3-type cytochrome oxidase maturation protein